MEAVLEPPGHDADHARNASLRRTPAGTVRPAGRGQFHGLFQDNRLDRLALAIVGVEELRQRFGLGQVRG